MEERPKMSRKLVFDFFCDVFSTPGREAPEFFFDFLGFQARRGPNEVDLRACFAPPSVRKIISFHLAYLLSI